VFGRVASILEFGPRTLPFGFSSALVPEKWKLPCGPAVGIIDRLRWYVLGSQSGPYAPRFLSSLDAVAAYLWMDVRYFRQTERTKFIDRL
jgi:lipopolysaccharide transport system permease protein